MFLVDSAALNAYVLYDGNGKRRKFLYDLSDQLMKGQKNRRKVTKPHWTYEKFVQIDQLFERYLFGNNFIYYFFSLSKKAKGEEKTTVPKSMKVKEKSTTSTSTPL